MTTSLIAECLKLGTAETLIGKRTKAKTIREECLETEPKAQYQCHSSSG